jgi:osmoprotectant transport system permease protein
MTGTVIEVVASLGTFWTDFTDTVSANYDELFTRTIEHLSIVSQTALISSVIGIVLGILCARYRQRLAPLVIGTASVILTLPSYALFGYFGVTLGYNDRAVILALTLYAMLPIIRNTYVGLTQVSPAVEESARGMGMSNRQILLRVRLPIALPVIMAGIRQATVLNVAIATIGAAIASGGLGTPIFHAIGRSELTLLLAATILVAAVGIGADLILGLIERVLRERYFARARAALVLRLAR